MLDLTKIPFSRFGSYFVFSQDAESKELFLRDVHGGDEAPSRLFKIELLQTGEVVPFCIVAEEHELMLYKASNKRLDGEDCVRFCISEPALVQFYGAGQLGIRMTAVKTKYDNILQLSLGRLECHFYSKELKLMLSCESAETMLDAPWNIIGNDYIKIDFIPKNKVLSVAIECYKTVWRQRQHIDYFSAVESVKKNYHAWLASMPQVPLKYEPSKRLASYITWSSVVHAEGRLTRDAMFMSKNWMYNIWSWDNCFNALMLAENHPELALDQLLVFADNQDESGIYADFINDRFCSFSCCKPPIHAWAFKRMRSRNSLFNQLEIVRKIYDSVSKATNYWLAFRMDQQQRLPMYKHGNDSGWDNASVFHQGIPVEAPDLAAHLIRQMDILAEMALELSQPEQAAEWKHKSDHMLELLLQRLQENGSFFARTGMEGTKVEHRGSLLLRMPIVAGTRLPELVRERLIYELQQDFLCEFGLSTEAKDSQLYRENGYWLGPVWAPVMYLIVDALYESGYEKLAKECAQRFCDATLIGGMAENFDPHTGEGLVDPAFTWTSSVFLLLAAGL